MDNGYRSIFVEYFSEFVRIALLELCMSIGYALCALGAEKVVSTSCSKGGATKKKKKTCSIKIGNKIQFKSAFTKDFTMARMSKSMQNK